VDPRPSHEFLKGYYAQVGHGQPTAQSLAEILRRERDYPNSSLDARRMLNTIVRTLEGRSPQYPRTLLDVGCGYGFFAREALARGFVVRALEPALVERSIAEEMSGLKPIPESFEEFRGSDGSFVAILMSQILEHALDVNVWIDKANRLLCPGGVLAIALPNFGSIFRLLMQEREPYICPPAHLNFFSAKSLSRLLEKKGLEVREIQCISRLDPKVLLRRIPAGRFLGRGLALGSRLTLDLFDTFHFGMMVNIYAQKPSLL
jgi:2-polyprenyl-3-methyl-5-hydroxy-6-metoxy-1,4-benzoquinol methylase